MSTLRPTTLTDSWSLMTFRMELGKHARRSVWLMHAQDRFQSPSVMYTTNKTGGKDPIQWGSTSSWVVVHHQVVACHHRPEILITNLLRVGAVADGQPYSDNMRRQSLSILHP